MPAPPVGVEPLGPAGGGPAAHRRRRHRGLGARAATHVGELDRVLQGGLVPGSVTLLGGEPGIGKSTLLLQALAGLATAGQRCLYVTAEESAQQVRLRAERLGALPPNLWLVSDTALPARARPHRCRRSRRRGRRLDPDGASSRRCPRRRARSPRCASAPTASCGRPRTGRCRLGAGRPRHQGRRARRPAGARAPRRHRAVVRGRAPPRPPPAAGREAPLRLHRRARPVRDDRRRARRACPTRRRCSSPTAARARRARSSRRCSTATGRCSSRCRRSSRRVRAPHPAPVGAGPRQRPAGAGARRAAAARRAALRRAATSTRWSPAA